MSSKTPTIPNELPPVDYLDRLFDKVKGRLFMKKGAGFLGSLLCNHRFVWDLTRPTAWCDGRTIGFNPYFFLMMDLEGRITVLAHELWHTGFSHMVRRGDRDPRIWNIAADHVINTMMERDGFSFQNLHDIGASPCLHHRFDGMATEVVYDILVSEGYVPPPKMPRSDCPGGQQNGQDGDPSQGSSQPGDAQPGDEQPTAEIDDMPGLSGDLVETPGIDKQEVSGKVVQAAQVARMSKEAGNLPGEIVQTIEKFLFPVMPWHTLLHRYFNELDQSDYSWKRPNRRYEQYLPSLHADNGLEHLVYYLDISGSITDEQALRFFSEVKHIHEDLMPKRLTLVTFTTMVRDVYELEEGDSFDKFEINGRGGTALSDVFRDIKERSPTAAVIFTDLRVRIPQVAPKTPIIWACMDNPSATVPYGTLFHIPKEVS